LPRKPNQHSFCTKGYQVPHAKESESKFLNGDDLAAYWFQRREQKHND